MNRLCALEFLDLLYRLRQQVEWAGCGTNGFAGNVCVTGRGAQAAMAKQDLDDADVSAGFQKMSREGMPQRTYMHPLGQAGRSAGLDTDLWIV